MASAQDPPEILEAINTYPQAPGQAIEQLKPLADAGNRRALAALTTFMMLQGQHEEALPYVKNALELGLGAIGQLYANDFAARRPELRDQIPEFVRVALDGGWSLDYRTIATHAAQPDSSALLSQLLDVVVTPRPLGAGEQWEQLVTKATTESKQITDAVAEVAARRDQAFREMDDAEQHMGSRRSEVDKVVDELGVVVSEAGAHSLANAYAAEAKRTDNQARTYTVASIVLGVASVVISFISLIRLKAGSSIETAVVHAAYGLPLALFAAYVNKLANAHRREGWRLRHVELQIRTTNPFLALLDDERRRETLAALALRFFPGQESIETGHPHDAQSVPLDVIEAIRALLRAQSAAGAVPGATPPAP